MVDNKGMIQLAIAAALTTLQVKDVDVWFVPNIDVTDHSPFDHTPNGTYDARDVFGGTFGSVPHEWGHVVFEDDSGGTGQPDFIEWTTKAPVSINRILFTWQDDSPGNNWR